MVESRFPESGLAAEYGDIVFASVEAPVIVTISITNGVTLLSETYTADGLGEVRIREIGTLAMLYVAYTALSLTAGRDGLPIYLTVSAVSDEVEIEKDIVIYPSTVDFQQSLSLEALALIPLCRATKKETAIGRKEFVSFYGDGVVKAYIVYKTPTKDTAVTHNVATLASESIYYRVNVSPSVIAALAGIAEADIIYYNIYIDLQYIVRFTIQDRNFPEQTQFVFRNCFGAMEVFTCTGSTENSRKWNRELGVVNNRTVIATKDIEQEFKTATGYLSRQQIDTVEDMLNSDELYIIESGSLLEVIITEEDFSTTSRADLLNGCTFSYAHTQANRILGRYTAFAKPGIFTPDFDNTFE